MTQAAGQYFEHADKDANARSKDVSVVRPWGGIRMEAKKKKEAGVLLFSMGVFFIWGGEEKTIPNGPRRPGTRGHQYRGR